MNHNLEVPMSFFKFKPFLLRLHFSAEELLLYPRRPCPRRRQRRRRRPHAKC